MFQTQRKGDIQMEPSLPGHHLQMVRSLQVGCLMKCIVTYKRKFWEKNGLSGMTLHWPYYAAEASVEHPVSLTYDATSSNGQPALVGFVGGSLVAKLNVLDVCPYLLLHSLCDFSSFILDGKILFK